MRITTSGWTRLAAVAFVSHFGSLDMPKNAHAADAVLVREINLEATRSSSPGDFVVVGDGLFFTTVASDHRIKDPLRLTTGRSKLWVTDGTPEGTRPVLEPEHPVFLNALVVIHSAVAVESVVFFVVDYVEATDHVVIFESQMWKSDGTDAGTDLVFEASSIPFLFGPIRETAASGGTLYFSMWSSEAGSELWKSDGTSGGTSIVKDINPDGSSSPRNFFEINGELFFSVDDGTLDDQLWKTDGSEAGTVPVADVLPASAGVEMNGVVFFSAQDANFGRELWRSDGTGAGTFRVADISSGPESSNPASFAVVDGVLFFSADDGLRGAELWKSTGTPESTVIVRDIQSAPGVGSDLRHLTEGAGKLFFVADGGEDGNELWVSDGTEGETTLVRDIFPGEGGSLSRDLTSFGAFVYFCADDGTNGRELWRSAGTRESTTLVKDVSSGTSNCSRLRSCGDRLCFVADDGIHGSELWSTDGSESETSLVADLELAERGADPVPRHILRETLYFTATDSPHGYELWKSDGTTAGTVVIDLNPGPASSGVLSVSSLDGFLFLADIEGRIWKSDGSTEGTVLLKDAGVTQLISFDDALYGSGPAALWKSDGSADGTILLKEFPHEPYFGSLRRPRQLTPGHMLFFVMYDDDHGEELWRSDGTTAGTLMLKDIYEGPESSSVGNILTTERHAFFQARDRDHYSMIWVSDGTPEGTIPLSVGVTEGSGLGDLTLVGETLYFREILEIGSIHLWKSDGTPEGTVLVKEFSAVPVGAYFRLSSATLNGKLAFTVVTEHDESEIWQSDGTEEGTVPLVSVKSRPWRETHGGPRDLFEANGLLFFLVNDKSGMEPWVTDGTPAGTEMVTDIWPGAGSSDPWQFIEVAGALFFAADDGTHGLELWAIHPESFRRGDANADGRIDISDAITTFGYLFGGHDQPPCLKSADAEDSGEIQINDGIYLLNFLFLNTREPAQPFPDCGRDLTPRTLSCVSYDACAS